MTESEPKVWGALLALGIFAIVAQLCLTRAYAYAPAAQVGPFIYAAVVFAAVLDWLIWRKLPDGLFVVGAALVIAAGILTLRLRYGERAAAPLPGLKKLVTERTAPQSALLP